MEKRKGKGAGRGSRRKAQRPTSNRWMLRLPLDPEQEGRRMAQEVTEAVSREFGLAGLDLDPARPQGRRK